MIKLRQYQEKGVEELRSFFSKNPSGNVVFQSPTGTGKTVVFTYMASQAIKKGKKVLILSNRTELMSQAGGAFEKFGVTPTYLDRFHKTPPIDTLATSGMMQTLHRRLETPEGREFLRTRDFIIGDEIHIADIDKIIDSELVEHIPIVGTTATPRRMGGQTQLGMLWDDMVLGEQVKYFVERGWLMPDRYFGIDCGDVSDIPYDSKTGDYQGYAMYKHFDKREKYAGVIDNYRTHTNKTRALTFCSNQHHAIKTAVAFDKVGIDTRFLVSGISKPNKPDRWEDEIQRVRYEQHLELYMLLNQYKHLTGDRKVLLDDLKSGKITNLVNVAMLTTGVDIPNLETVIMDRYTLSLPLFLQCLGRGSRPCPEIGKIHFNVLDFGNSSKRKENNLGFYMDSRPWGLWHETSKGGGIAGSKLCDKNKEDKNKKRGCNRLVHIGAKMCRCGFIFTTEKELKEAELREIAYEGAVPEEVLVSTMNAKQLQAYSKLKIKGNKHRWVLRKLYYKNGAESLKAGLKELGYKSYYYLRIKKEAQEQGWAVKEV